MTKTDKKVTDWERIEADYRAGLLSVREIGESQGVSHTAIQKRAKANGWERDLSAKIKARADALVAKRQVATSVATEAKVATDNQIVLANAEVIANVRLNHRKDIGRARTLAMALLAELESQTSNLELIHDLGEILGDKDGNAAVSDKMMDLYHAITSLPGRTKTMKDLGDTLHKLIGLEREAYNIGSGGEPPPASGQVVAVDAQQVATALAQLRADF